MVGALVLEEFGGGLEGFGLRGVWFWCSLGEKEGEGGFSGSNLGPLTRPETMQWDEQLQVKQSLLTRVLS